jgi:hypothetical protein
MLRCQNQRCRKLESIGDLAKREREHWACPACGSAMFTVSAESLGWRG